MPCPSSVPKYGLHKPSGQAVCYVDRKPVYLGRHGSPESRRKYGELLAQLESAPRVASSAGSPRPLTLAELLLKFATEHLPKYKTPEGGPSAEQDCYKGVIKIIRELFAETPAAEFGPVKLRLVRKQMVATGWSRKHINRQVCRARAIFKWAVGWELVPASVFEALRAVAALEPGETSARETEPRRAVAPAELQAVRAQLLDRHRDVFDLLLLTGARRGELMNLRTREVDRTSPLWRAELEHHKTAKKGKSRTLYFNTKAQAILRRYLTDDPDARILPVSRKTFSEVVGRACDRAGVKRFTAHTLRHCVATRITDELGIEWSQRLLGHSSAAMTAHYSALAEAKAAQAVQTLD